MSQYPGDMRGERVDVAPRICRVFQVPPRYSLGILLVFSSTMDGYDLLWTFCPGNRGSGLPCPRRKFSQQVEALLDGDAAAEGSEVGGGGAQTVGCVKRGRRGVQSPLAPGTHSPVRLTAATPSSLEGE